MLSKIRAVAFDLDNTLWEIEPVIARAESRLLAWMQEHCPRVPERVSMEEMRAARQQLALDEPHRAHDLVYLRTAVLTRHVLQCGYDEDIAERAYEVFFAARHEVDLFHDVRPALERLRNRYALATLTNGNADVLRIGLADLFAVSLTARQIGYAKPHPRVFAHLAEALELEPAEILYVGDDPTADVDGARSAGLRTAWMNRGSILWPEDIAAADAVVVDCMELASLLLAAQTQATTGC